MTPPVTCFGGKVTAGSKIAAMLPPHEHYVEPFAGSRAVLLAKRPGRTGTVNDLARSFTTFSPAQGAPVAPDQAVPVSEVAAMLGVLGTGTSAKAARLPGRQGPGHHPCPGRRLRPVPGAPSGACCHYRSRGTSRETPVARKTRAAPANCPGGNPMPGRAELAAEVVT